MKKTPQTVIAPGERDPDAVAPRVSLAQYVRNIKMELSRVVFPTRKETTVTTIMVFIMVVIMSAFFFMVDQVLSWGVRLILG
ncbi:MAG: preprotein translocase subunit SecE [Holosporales bacterium]|jgi:preprotein translocase subunit SecE